VLNTDGNKISSTDLDKIQKSLETEKIGHGDLKGKPYLRKGDQLNLNVLFKEKEGDAKNFNNPECILYFLFPILDYRGNEVGEVCMELKDHHSHDASIKLNFNSVL